MINSKNSKGLLINDVNQSFDIYLYLNIVLQIPFLLDRIFRFRKSQLTAHFLAFHELLIKKFKVFCFPFIPVVANHFFSRISTKIKCFTLLVILSRKTKYFKVPKFLCDTPKLLLFLFILFFSSLGKGKATLSRTFETSKTLVTAHWFSTILHFCSHDRSSTQPLVYARHKPDK